MFHLSIVTLADAGKTDDKDQPGMISGLLIDSISSGSVFHAFTKFSKRAKRPVKSVSSAQVLGKSAAADEAYLLKDSYCKLLGVSFPLSIFGDKKDLYETISTKRLISDILSKRMLHRYYMTSKLVK